ncbi:hypothetical protein DL93DRAFT_923114 [Clavulina sp. PMI_390]|nr:hypothetical protein DL93DRAFT_923114 [Clavulina sp. PMI_390]
MPTVKTKSAKTVPTKALNQSKQKKLTDSFGGLSKSATMEKMVPSAKSSKQTKTSKVQSEAEEIPMLSNSQDDYDFPSPKNMPGKSSSLSPPIAALARAAPSSSDDEEIDELMSVISNADFSQPIVVDPPYPTKPAKRANPFPSERPRQAKKQKILQHPNQGRHDDAAPSYHSTRQIHTSTSRPNSPEKTITPPPKRLFIDLSSPLSHSPNLSPRGRELSVQPPSPPLAFSFHFSPLPSPGLPGDSVIDALVHNDDPRPGLTFDRKHAEEQKKEAQSPSLTMGSTDAVEMRDEDEDMLIDRGFAEMIDGLTGAVP